MSPTKWNQSWCCLLLGLAVWPAAATTARADEKVQVTVYAILATDRNKDVNPKLKGIAQEVQKREPKLTGFRIERTTVKSLEVGDSYEFPLVDKEVATVKIKHGCDKNNRVGLTVKPPKVGDIVYSSCCGKCFPIVTRYQTKDNDRLILAIMVNPCGKK